MLKVPTAASHGDWEDSLHVLQEMVHHQQQQQAHQIYNKTQMEQALNQQNFSADRFRQSAAFNASTAKFPGESDLLNLLQFPRDTTTAAPIPSFGCAVAGAGSRGKGPLYSTSAISGPVNAGSIYDSSRSMGYEPLLNHHFQFNSSQRYNFHNLSRRAASSEATRQAGAPILVDLDQEREDLSIPKNLASNFGAKRDHGAASGKGEPRGVNHFATERQRREFLNEKYHTLRSLVPNPTKVSIL